MKGVFALIEAVSHTATPAGGSLLIAPRNR